MLKHLISFSGDWDLFDSCLVLLTVDTRDWGNSFSMPLVLCKMPKVCPVAAQVITFKSDGALCPLLGVSIPLQDIQIIYKLSTCMLSLASNLLALNVCWFWWQLIFISVLCWLWDLSVIVSNVNQLPSWEAFHAFLSVLPNKDDLHVCLVNRSKVHVCTFVK